MKTPDPRLAVQSLMELMLDNQIEVVSFGLAPNPNGFCIESHGNASGKILRAVSGRLEALSPAERDLLKSWCF